MGPIIPTVISRRSNDCVQVVLLPDLFPEPHPLMYQIRLTCCSRISRYLSNYIQLAQRTNRLLICGMTYCDYYSFAPLPRHVLTHAAICTHSDRCRRAPRSARSSSPAFWPLSSLVGVWCRVSPSQQCRYKRRRLSGQSQTKKKAAKKGPEDKASVTSLCCAPK